MNQPETPRNADNNEENRPQIPPSPSVLPAGASASGGLRQPRQVRSDALLQGDREVQIIHGDEIYRLSVTRQGKLILHK